MKMRKRKKKREGQWWRLCWLYDPPDHLALDPNLILVLTLVLTLALTLALTHPYHQKSD